MKTWYYRDLDYQIGVFVEVSREGDYYIDKDGQRMYAYNCWQDKLTPLYAIARDLEAFLRTCRNRIKIWHNHKKQCNIQDTKQYAKGYIDRNVAWEKEARQHLERIQSEIAKELA